MRIMCVFRILPPLLANAATSGPPSGPKALKIDQPTHRTLKGRWSLLALPTSDQNKANLAQTDLHHFQPPKCVLAHGAPCCLAASIQNGDFVVIVDVQGPNALIWCGRVGFRL